MFSNLSLYKNSKVYRKWLSENINYIVYLNMERKFAYILIYRVHLWTIKANYMPLHTDLIIVAVIKYVITFSSTFIWETKLSLPG